MTRRLVRPLLALAVRRWPAHLRDEMRAEWEAELHELASQRRQARMLRFAASLAATRPRLGPRQPFLDADTSAGRVLRHAAFLVAAPAACVALSLHVIPFIALLLTVLIVMLAAVAGLSSPLLGPWSVVAAVLTPAACVVLVNPSLVPSLSGAWRQPTTTLLWALVLGAALTVASGRSRRTAALASGAGAVAACWSAVTLTIAPHAAGLGLDTSYAPLWYPASVLDPVGVPLGALPADPNLCVTSDSPAPNTCRRAFHSWTSPRDTPPP
ncbi:hypothetical protein WEI85_21930 [Actinomycetes bacterium KLBMP 9797]